MDETTKKTPDYQRLMLRQARIHTVLLVLLLLLAVGVGIFVCSAVLDVKEQLEILDLEGINAIIEDVEALTSSLDVEAINEAVSSLREAAGELGGVDLTSFNELIDSLKTVAGRLESVGTVFDRIFG